jgi:hypothetical protein
MTTPLNTETIAELVAEFYAAVKQMEEANQIAAQKAKALLDAFPPKKTP